MIEVPTYFIMRNILIFKIIFNNYYKETQHLNCFNYTVQHLS